ncbi:ribbon-helix-helix domain-containing protein [Streptomyces caniscabiei]|uniref:CopG family transcriptional regulator n=1 Tax=Streptomyces caniscabiei TaxID=2746961 RepID=UPI0029B2CFB0|nr:CopG family transcriptional regulator [Streptomyces caniscabiei]MDX2776549.1 ribbon-helix-helix domain-containing protein [Streptomyces caniscabiei]
MIVHLSGSLHNLEEDLEYLQTIVGVIHDLDSTLAFNWIDPAVIQKKENIQVKDWTPHVQHNLDAIKKADVVIIDASHYAFSHGFQTAAALEHNKPVLVVSRDRFKHKYITGFTSHLLSYSQYTSKEELEKIVRTFLKKNVVHTKDLRFNMFLTREIVQYLDERSQESGVNRSEIIRDLIRKASERQGK